MPVRAYRTYLKASARFRVNTKYLFLSLNEPHKAVTKGTISGWLKSLIKRAYVDANNQDITLLKITAHEIRAMATSLAFSVTQSLEVIKKAAQWRTAGTFQRHFTRCDALPHE